MTRIALRLLLAVALVAIGWSIRLAQNIHGQTEEIFRLKIDSPTGSTTIKCEEGCQFLSWKDGRSTVSRTFTLACNGPQSCSETIGGAMARPQQVASSAPAASE